MPGLKPTDRELVLRMSGGRPRQAAPAHVTVFLADREIGRADPDGQFRDYTFAIPEALARALAAKPGVVEARIESTTWTPRDVLGGTDDRALGVMIDRAEIRVVFDHLQIPYRQERMLVGLADAGLRTAKLLGWPRAARASTGPPERILLLRLERIGDLLMVIDAIQSIRSLASQAHIDLIVGSWNLALAKLIPGINVVETLDVPWMAREGAGSTWPALVQRAREWRSREYDLAINFEPDIRSNLLLALSGAGRRVGFTSGGGGAVLTDAIAPDPRAHIAVNASALVERAFGRRTPVGEHQPVRLNIPDEARRKAADARGGRRGSCARRHSAGRRTSRQGMGPGSLRRSGRRTRPIGPRIGDARRLDERQAGR